MTGAAGGPPMLVNKREDEAPPEFIPLWFAVGLVIVAALHVYVYYHASRGDAVLGMASGVAMRVALLSMLGFAAVGSYVARRRWKQAQAAARERRS